MIFIFFIFLKIFSADINDLAYSSYISGNFEKAKEYYSALWQIKADVNSLLNLAMIHKFLDDYKNSLSILEKAASIKADSDIFCEIGWLYFHISNNEKAVENFQKAVEIDPSNYNAFLGLAAVYSQMRDFINSEKYLVEYKKLRGAFAGVDYIFAWNYVNFNMYDKAKYYLIETLRKDPTFVEARFPLAQLYLKEGDYNNAWNQYYRILDYYPDHPVALSMVKLIEGKLTKQPEEIRPPFKIKNPTIIDDRYDINSFKRSVKLRVAIGTDNMGRHRANKKLVFRSFVDIAIYDKEEKKNIIVPKGDKIVIEYNGEIIVSLLDKKQQILKTKKGFFIKPLDQKNGTIIVESDIRSSNPYFRYSDREYRGEFEIVPTKKGFGIVNIIELELYLLGVVGAEMDPQWPIEALKAQAVIARTEALRRMKEGPHKKDGYHLCDAEHCQVYRGVGYERNSVTKAVFETQGLVLTYNDKLAYTFYHSNCGGYIQSSQEAGWGGKITYLNSHPDSSLTGNKLEGLTPWEFNVWIKKNPPAYCNYPGVVRDTEYRWLRIIKRSDLNYKLNDKYGLGEIKSIVIQKRSRSGNVTSIKIIGSKRNVVIEKEHIIRSTFGISSLKSTLFNLEINRYPDGRIRNFWFYGGGWGHSVGLCQGGAAGMAGKEGKNFREILDFYYPGTKLKKIKIK